MSGMLRGQRSGGGGKRPGAFASSTTLIIHSSWPPLEWPYQGGYPEDSEVLRYKRPRYKGLSREWGTSTLSPEEYRPQFPPACDLCLNGTCLPFVFPGKDVFLGRWMVAGGWGGLHISHHIVQAFRSGCSFQAASPQIFCFSF